MRHPAISYPGVYNLYAPDHKSSLMACASLFFDDQVQSLAHTHVGSSPIAGPRAPFFGQTPGFLLFSVSDRIYGVLFLFSLSAPAPRVASDVPQGPESPRCALIASIRCAVRPSLLFAAL
jgi:hypothetical protein